MRLHLLVAISQLLTIARNNLHTKRMKIPQFSISKEWGLWCQTGFSDHWSESPLGKFTDWWEIGHCRQVAPQAYVESCCKILNCHKFLHLLESCPLPQNAWYRPCALMSLLINDVILRSRFGEIQQYLRKILWRCVVLPYGSLAEFLFFDTKNCSRVTYLEKFEAEIQ